MKRYNKAYIEITNVCNLNCTFCPKTAREKQFMSVENFKIVINEIDSLTDYAYFHVLGEPTLHPNLKEFVEIANTLNKKITITTNGTLLENIDEILQAQNLYKVNISLQAVGANDGIELEKYMEKVIDFALRASLKKTIVVLRLWNIGSKINRNDEILKILKSHFGEFDFVDKSSVTLKNRVFLEKADEFVWKCDDSMTPLFCYGLRDQFGILVDGTVVPCCIDSEGEIPIGNVFGQKLVDILESQLAKEIYDGFTNKQARQDRCKHCGYARRFKI